MAVIFQSSLFTNFFRNGLAPDLLLVVVIFFAARFDFQYLWKIIFLAGFLKDILLFFPVGANIAALALVAFVTNILVRKFIIIHSSWKFFIFLVLVACGTVLYNISLDGVMRFFSSVHGENIEAFSFARFQILRTVLLHAGLGIILYVPLKKLENIASRYGQPFITQRNVR